MMETQPERVLASDRRKPLSVGARLALIGLAVHVVLSVVGMIVLGVADRQPVAAWTALAIGVVLVGLLASGIVRRWRAAYLIGVFLAGSQIFNWVTFMTADPKLAPIPPFGGLLVAVGLVMSWRDSWDRPA